MSGYLVDVTIPVHSATRPIRRAVQSVLANTAVTVRVTVVAHNLDPAIVRANLQEFADHPAVRVLSLQDGIPSPAGPLNLGLSSAEAPYVSLLGSDDILRPGALDSWVSVAQETAASTVIPRIEGERSGVLPLPPTRRARTRDLHPVRDRLLYRCSPVGLISRAHFPNLRFTPGLHSGEDLAFTAELWFCGSHIAYDRTGPAYFGYEDETDRVSQTPRPVTDDFEFLDAVESASWFRRLNHQQRQAFGVKTLRLHVFDAIAGRLETPEGFGVHRTALLRVISRIDDLAPGSIRLLSRCDRGVLDELRRDAPDINRIRALLAARWGGGTDAVLPRNPFLAFHSQAPYLTLTHSRP